MASQVEETHKEENERNCTIRGGIVRFKHSGEATVTTKRGLVRFDCFF